MKVIDGREFKVWRLPNPLLLHWVLNPGLAINEIFFGQRVPTECLLENTDEAFADRTYVQCPHCDALYNSKIWGHGGAFGHYNGLYCPDCEGKIPTLFNLFSILILIITFPIWKPLQMIYGERVKARSLAKAREGLANPNAAKPTQVSGLKMGLFFGCVMGAYFFVVSTQADPIHRLIRAIITGLLAGLFFGVTMSFIMKRRGSQAK